MAPLGWTLPVKLDPQTLGTCRAKQDFLLMSKRLVLLGSSKILITMCLFALGLFVFFTWDFYSAAGRCVVCVGMAAFYNNWLGGQTATLRVCGNVLQFSDTQLQKHISNLHGHIQMPNVNKLQLHTHISKSIVGYLWIRCAHTGQHRGQHLLAFLPRATGHC